MNNDNEIEEFDWAKEFPQVCDENGNFEGFDVVMGNPPYISIKEIPQNHKQYCIENYKTAKGQFDLYTLFIEKSFDLLNNHGSFSMITSNTYFSNKNLQPIRKFLLDNVKIEKLVNLDESVFKEAKLDVGITFYNKDVCKDDYKINIIPNKACFLNNTAYSLPKNYFDKSENNTFTIHILPSDYQIFNKMKENAILLSEIANINRGIEYGSNSKEIKSTPKKDTFPIIVGHSIEKYRIKEFEGYAKFKENDKSNYKNFELYSKPRILVQRIRNLSLKTRLVATYTDETVLCTNTLRVITIKKPNFDYKYILALLNSRLINYYFSKHYINKDIYAYQLGQIPIKKADRNIQEKICNIVSEIEKSSSDKQKLKSQTQIDKIVYKLYGLNKKEIAEIEKFYE